MPFKPPEVQPDFSSLITSLDNSRMQKTNYSLYQTIFFLIQNTQKARDLIVKSLKNIDKELSEVFAATFLTVNDESAKFVNSRKLLAGTNVTFDDTIPHQRTINVSGGAASNHYDSPLSDGDLSAADLIFANGECIIVQVPV